VYANTGDRIWWTWDGDAVADVKESLLILEEDKVLNPVSRKQEEPEDESERDNKEKTSAENLCLANI